MYACIHSHAMLYCSIPLRSRSFSMAVACPPLLSLQHEAGWSMALHWRSSNHTCTSQEAWRKQWACELVTMAHPTHSWMGSIFTLVPWSIKIEVTHCLPISHDCHMTIPVAQRSPSVDARCPQRGCQWELKGPHRPRDHCAVQWLSHYRLSEHQGCSVVHLLSACSPPWGAGEAVQEDWGVLWRHACELEDRARVTSQPCVVCTITSYIFIRPGVMQESTLYKASQDIEYLDMVLNESLRMYPPTPRWLSMWLEACEWVT